jgi:hypothetical protein
LNVNATAGTKVRQFAVNHDGRNRPDAKLLGTGSDL